MGTSGDSANELSVRGLKQSGISARKIRSTWDQHGQYSMQLYIDGTYSQRLESMPYASYSDSIQHNLGTARKSVGTMPRRAKNSRHFSPQARLVHAWLREDPGIPRLTRRITRGDRHAPAPPRSSRIPRSVARPRQ